VTFEQAVKAIAAHAFVRHQTPFILNLENHVGRAQSVRMANILNTFLGSRILTSDDPVYGHDAILYRACGLPTLEQLKGRVLVRTKVRISAAPATTLRPSPSMESTIKGERLGVDVLKSKKTQVCVCGWLVSFGCV
jgi:hypothetical protein